MLDAQDPYNQPYNGGTAPDPYNPTTNPNGTQSIADAIAQIYRQALGREATPQEIQNQITGGHGDIASIQQSIYNSPEAQAYNASKQAKPGGPDAPNPDPNAPPTGGPAPGPIAPPVAPPAPTPPVAPPVTTPPAFSYEDFKAPDANDLLADKGFQFENQQGLQAIGAKNAALGTLNTGGTIKDFESFGQNLAATRYNDLFNRKMTEYGTNRGNALDTYNTNYGTQYKDPFQMRFQNAELNQNTNQYNSNMDWQKFLQSYKSTVTDPFEQKYKILGLL